MTQAAPSLLLLIPAYNEEKRIEPTLRDYAQFFRESYLGKFQLVVVLNGCRDDTLGVVNRVAKDHPEISALNFPDPIGKGGALIEGLKLAPTADLIGYVDADGATGPKAFCELVRLTAQADCVIGSRWLPGAVLHQSQPWERRFFSRVFHAIVRALFWRKMNFADTQCPAKVMRRVAIERIHSALRIADRVLEVPTEWTDKLGSKVTQSLLRSSLVMFLSVVRLRLIYTPLYHWLRPLRPLETWIYQKLKQPVPRRGPQTAKSQSRKSKA